MKYKAEIKILLNQELLDPQSVAIKNTLINTLNFDMIEHFRLGKYIVVEVNCDNQVLAKESIEKMCDQLLANPVMEDYTITMK
jgi:phosphoribosylformylglycinamidine synthase